MTRPEFKSAFRMFDIYLLDSEVQVSFSLRDTIDPIDSVATAPLTIHHPSLLNNVSSFST